MRYRVTVDVDADDNATCQNIAAFMDSAIAEACHADMEDPVAGFDGIWHDAEVQELGFECPTCGRSASWTDGRSLRLA